MRICLYTETALPKMGGQEMVVDALARQYLTLGHEPVVLAPNPRRPLRPNDGELPYPVVRHPRFFSTRFFVSWYRWFLQRLHARRRFDVLHCHGIYPPSYLAALSRHKLGVPVVVTSHGGDVYERNVRLAKPVLKQRHIEGLRAADALVAISQFTREGFRRLCPDARQVVDIPNGVHLEPFAARAERPSDLDRAIAPGAYAVFVGRLKHRKGVDVLLEALARVPATNAVQLVIVGEGEERPALQAQAEHLGLGARARFVGQQSGAAKIYLLQNARFAIVPSRLWEAFGLVVLESYAAGIPVIASRMPGLHDLIEPGRTGYLVSPESPAELAEKMQALFADDGEARRMGDYARRISQRYGWPVVAERHVQLYDRLRRAREPMAA